MEKEEFHYLHNKIFQVFFILKWSIFCLMHAALLVVILLLIWWFQISPSELTDEAKIVLTNSLPSSILQNFWVMWGFFGFSGATILWLYARTWNWLFATWSNRFIFSKNGKNS